MQVGALTVALPLLSMAWPARVEREHAGTFRHQLTAPAVATAWITGAADMNSELKGRRC